MHSANDLFPQNVAQRLVLEDLCPNEFFSAKTNVLLLDHWCYRGRAGTYF